MAKKIVSNDGMPKKNRPIHESNRVVRKRELDRVAQRASRERNRNRIQFLEKKLACLEAKDQPSKLSDLMKVVSELREENERLRTTLRKVHIFADLELKSCKEYQTKPFEARSPSVPPSDADHSASENTCKGVFAEPIDQVGTSIESERLQICDDRSPDSQYAEVPEAPCDPDGESYAISDQASASLHSPISSPGSGPILPTWSNDIPSPLLSLLDFDPASIYWASSPTSDDPYSSSLTCLPDEAKWSFGNEAYTRAIESFRRLETDSHLIEPHVPLLAIHTGWDNVDDKQRSHPMWKALRGVDELIFNNWSKAQKTAIMLVTHRLVLYRANPTKQNLERVPKFLRPLPSQEYIQHPLVIDFLIWPELRDRLIFSHQIYSCTGDFSAAYCAYLQFYWPFPDQYIFNYDSSNNTCRISPLFEKYAFDSKNWTVGEQFFGKFPEMQLDLPCSSGGQTQGPTTLDNYTV